MSETCGWGSASLARIGAVLKMDIAMYDPESEIEFLGLKGSDNSSCSINLQSRSMSRSSSCSIFKVFRNSSTSLARAGTTKLLEFLIVSLMDRRWSSS